MNLTFAVYVKLSEYTQKKKGSSLQTLHCDGFFLFFNSCRNFRIQWGSRDTPGCKGTWMGLHSFPRNEREEFCKCDEFCKSLVFRLRWSLIYSLFKTVAQLQTSWIIEQFFYAFCVTFKRTRTSSHQVLQHTTEYAFLWLNQQARKTSLKNTNIGDIKHKWEYFQSLEPF